MTAISCGYSGKVWAVSTGGAMYFRSEVSNSRPTGTGWDLVDSDKRFIDVAVASDNMQIWAVETDHTVWLRTGVTEHNDEGEGWE